MTQRLCQGELETATLLLQQLFQQHLTQRLRQGESESATFLSLTQRLRHRESEYATSVETKKLPPAATYLVS